MDSRHRTLIKRTACIITMMVVMLVLCGCRTRITNNSEVGNVVYDEDGIMTEEYQMRREELGLSTAKKPLFTGFGAPEEEEDSYDYSGDSQMLEEYEPEEGDDYEETEEPETSQRTSHSGTAPEKRESGAARRRSSDGGSPSSSKKAVVVTLIPNGGTCDVDSVEVRTGGKYGTLPTPVREGYEFLGWYTKSEDGKKVTASTKVGATKNHLLFAHWKKLDKEVKTYTVTFNINSPEGEEATLSGSSKITVSEGGSYTGVPSAECTGYSFLGWFTAAEAGSGTEVREGTKVNIKADQTLYAHWEKDPEKYWTAQLLKVSGSISDDIKATYKDGSDHSEFLQDCGMKKGEDSYEFVIFYGSREDAEKADNPDGKEIIVIPSEAVSEMSKDSVKLVYKYKLFEALYKEPEVNVNQIAAELGISEEALEKMTIEIIPAPETPGDDGGDESGDESEG